MDNCCLLPAAWIDWATWYSDSDSGFPGARDRISYLTPLGRAIRCTLKTSSLTLQAANAVSFLTGL